jgi:hypothetical protein
MSAGQNADALRLLLAELGLTPDDLRRAASPIPTVAEYLPRVIAASGPGATRTYANYWTRFLESFGDRRLDEVTATDIEALMRQAVRDRVQRRNCQHLVKCEHVAPREK